MLREELWVRRVRLEGSSAAPVPASITLAAGMAVMTGYEMTCPRAREKMCAVNVSVEAVIASGPETLRNSQVGDAAATAARRPAARHGRWRWRRRWARRIRSKARHVELEHHGVVHQAVDRRVRVSRPLAQEWSKWSRTGGA